MNNNLKRLLAKSSVDFDQLSDRKDKGAKYIELHLNEGDVKTKKRREDILKRLNEIGLVAKVAHMPIPSKFNIEGLINKEGFKTIENVSKLAQDLGEYYNHETHIVMHQTLSKVQLEDWGMMEKIENKIKHLLETYPRITINLENLTALARDKDSFQLRESYFDENVKVCKLLRKNLKTNRIGTVLDIGHALATINIMDQFIKRGIIEDITLIDYFKVNKEVLNVIHLANSVDFGVDKDHGTGFNTKKDLELLERIIDYIKEIEYKNIITLELGEKDFTNAIQYEKTRNQILGIVKKSNKEMVVG